jgi:uncharacterized membrane protein YfcA
VEFIALPLAVSIGALLAGRTGWGGWIIPGAVAWIFLTPAEVLGLSQVISFSLDVVLVRARGVINWRPIRWVLLGALPALVLGALIASYASPTLLRLIASGLILTGAFPLVWYLAREHLPAPGLGFLGGLFTTTGGFGGPPLALALQDLDSGTTKKTMATTFLIIAAMALPILFLSGVDRPELLTGMLYGLALAPLCSAMTWWGLRRAPQGIDPSLVSWGRAICVFAALALLFQVLSQSLL